MFLVLGRYALVAGTDPLQHTNQVARLISRQIDPRNGNLCVTFYYQLNGKSIGYLDFFIKTVKSKQFETFWSRKGHQGNYWKKGAFTIPAQSEPYEVYTLVN